VLTKAINRVVVVLCVALYCFHADAQSCCMTPPDGEITSVIGVDPAHDTVTQFLQRLTGSGNWSGWAVNEYQASTPANGCWFSGANPAYDPEYPNPFERSGAWIVTHDDTFYPDNVGWVPTSVTYIRGSTTHVSLPCGNAAYQQLTITCPGLNNTFLLESSVTQTETIYKTYVYNCRAGICSTISH